MGSLHPIDQNRQKCIRRARRRVGWLQGSWGPRGSEAGESGFRRSWEGSQIALNAYWRTDDREEGVSHSRVL